MTSALDEGRGYLMNIWFMGGVAGCKTALVLIHLLQLRWDDMILHDIKLTCRAALCEARASSWYWDADVPPICLMKVLWGTLTYWFQFRRERDGVIGTLDRCVTFMCSFYWFKSVDTFERRQGDNVFDKRLDRHEVMVILNENFCVILLIFL